MSNLLQPQRGLQSLLGIQVASVRSGGLSLVVDAAIRVHPRDSTGGVHVVRVAGAVQTQLLLAWSVIGIKKEGEVEGEGSKKGINIIGQYLSPRSKMYRLSWKS